LEWSNRVGTGHCLADEPLGFGAVQGSLARPVIFLGLGALLTWWGYGARVPKDQRVSWDDMQHLPDAAQERVEVSRRWGAQLQEAICRIVGPIFLAMGLVFVGSDVF
jgi:hypothetical protein